MGKAKRERKKETDGLKEWFEEFSSACPWRKQIIHKGGICGVTGNPTKDKKSVTALVCEVTNCAPLYLANRLIQQTFGPRRYENDTPDSAKQH
ncbi:hypothetical protein LCGC14_0911030 [marine sediment metagenome]|uniref:Uncharacterized protein n=1 Tax=marine sediment metagenome TaxID=412755 RepID=A0A0F9PEF5_9ZZZZ|nr:hypothetical protein [Candidatus Aminicenantes bacterium]